MSTTPQIFELLIVLLALTGMGLAGLLAPRGKKGSGTLAYFLASRNVGWPALSISLVMTTLWGIVSISAGLHAPFDGSEMIVLGAIAAAGLVIFGILFAPRYRESRAATIPAFLAERYGKRVGLAVAVVSIGITLFIQIPFTILVGSRLLNAFLGWEYMSSAFLMIVVPGLCVIARGYHGVIGMQIAGGLVCGAGLLVLAFNGYSSADPLLGRLLSDAGLPSVMLLPGMALLGLWYTCIDQFAGHRSFVARSSAAVRNGSGVAAGLIALGIAVVAVGFGRAVSPAGQGLSSSTVTAGFLGAAILSLGIASLSGYFMSVATLFTADLFLVHRKKCDEVALVMVGRMTNTAVALLAILAASSVAFMGDRSIEWMIRAVVVAVPPVVAVTTIGLFWPRMHGRGASWALGVGWLSGLFQFGTSTVGNAGPMQAALLTFLCSALVLVAVSLASAPLGALGSLPQVSLEEGLGVRRT